MPVVAMLMAQRWGSQAVFALGNLSSVVSPLPAGPPPVGTVVPLRAAVLHLTGGAQVVGALVYALAYELENGW